VQSYNLLGMQTGKRVYFEVETANQQQKGKQLSKTSCALVLFFAKSTDPKN
jgi:hypothetical protein